MEKRLHDMVDELNERETALDGEILDSDDNVIDPSPPKNPFGGIASDQLVEPIWEQQAGESDIMYSRFLQYAMLPQGSRSAREFKEIYRGTSANSGALNKAVARWKWVERAAAYDLHRMRVVEEDWSEREHQRRIADYEAGVKLREKANEGLDKVDSEELASNPMGIARFLSLASDLQANAVPRMKLEPHQMSEVLDTASDDERKRVIEIMLARITESR